MNNDSKPNTISIDGTDYVRKDSISLDVKAGESVYKLGLAVIIRAVTYHYVGIISYISDTEIVLIKASWVAESGRWSNCLTTGSLNEVEPYPDCVSINRGAIVDISPWKHALPTAAR